MGNKSITQVIREEIKSCGIPAKEINEGGCVNFALAVRNKFPEANVVSDADFKELSEEGAVSELTVYDHSDKVPPDFVFRTEKGYWTI